MIAIATIIDTTPNNINTPIGPFVSKRLATAYGAIIPLIRPTAFDIPEPLSFASVGHISGTYTAEA